MVAGTARKQETGRLPEAGDLRGNHRPRLPTQAARGIPLPLVTLDTGYAILPPLRLPKRRDEYVIAVCDGMIDLAVALFGVQSKDLRSTDRCTLQVARVRQIAMYVTHVVLQLTMAETGTGYGRDRTTVIHACHVIEDLRDDADFDRIVACVEHHAASLFRLEKGADHG